MRRAPTAPAECDDVSRSSATSSIRFRQREYARASGRQRRVPSRGRPAFPAVVTQGGLGAALLRGTGGAALTRQRLEPYEKFAAAMDRH
jgi:hypothetical protein